MQHHIGLPARFWSDEFVLGFVGFSIGFHASVAAGGSLSQTDKGMVLYEVFGALSHMNGIEIARRFTGFSTSPSKPPRFERGADCAAIIAFYSLGKLRDEDDNPHVATAKAAAGKKQFDRGYVTALLVEMLFVEEVRDMT